MTTTTPHTRGDAAFNPNSAVRAVIIIIISVAKMHLHVPPPQTTSFHILRLNDDAWAGAGALKSQEQEGRQAVRVELRAGMHGISIQWWVGGGGGELGDLIHNQIYAHASARIENGTVQETLHI